MRGAVKSHIYVTSYMNASLAVPWRWRDVSLRCLRWLFGETRRTFGFPGWDDVTLGSRRRLPCLLPILVVSQNFKQFFIWILLFSKFFIWTLNSHLFKIMAKYHKIMFKILFILTHFYYTDYHIISYLLKMFCWKLFSSRIVPSTTIV